MDAQRRFGSMWCAVLLCLMFRFRLYTGHAGDTGHGAGPSRPAAGQQMFVLVMMKVENLCERAFAWISFWFSHLHVNRPMNRGGSSLRNAVKIVPLFIHNVAAAAAATVQLLTIATRRTQTTKGFVDPDAALAVLPIFYPAKHIDDKRSFFLRLCFLFSHPYASHFLYIASGIKSACHAQNFFLFPPHSYNNRMIFLCQMRDECSLRKLRKTWINRIISRIGKLLSFTIMFALLLVTLVTPTTKSVLYHPHPILLVCACHPNWGSG